MKNLFRIPLAILITSLIFVSCSSESNDDLQEINNKSNENITPFPNVYDGEFPKQSMADFVQSIEPYYEKDMSYEDLKNSLDPNNNLRDIKNEGDDLLYQAFIYLEQGTQEENMNGDKFITAFFKAFEYDETVGMKNFNNLSDSDFEIINKELFGLPNDYKTSSSENSSRCDWYNRLHS